MVSRKLAWSLAVASVLFGSDSIYRNSNRRSSMPGESNPDARILLTPAEQRSGENFALLLLAWALQKFMEAGGDEIAGSGKG